MRLIGLDPGLRFTGWGVIDVVDGKLTHVANGVVQPNAKAPMAERLAFLYDGVSAVIGTHTPEAAAIEETFVNRNAQSTLALGLARGVVLLAPARAGLSVAEYAANKVKKSVVGAGHAGKQQVMMMVKTLLPAAKIESDDAADALAVAICHAHYGASAGLLAEAIQAATKRETGVVQ
ncbi:MAG: crossover junction endodeoxyribonuclease RuvC [Alphaproteobacteria bacterium]|jgi:crossover junction endodeoxyribonuclease RuvC